MSRLSRSINEISSAYSRFMVVTRDALNWMMDHWRAGTAAVYTAICFTDFILLPIVYGIGRPDMLALLEASHHLSPAVREQLVYSAYQTYDPLTLKGSGLFHLSFGAILTGSAISPSQAPQMGQQSTPTTTPATTETEVKEQQGETRDEGDQRS